MGCALENLMLAAIANGYTASATMAPGKMVEASAYPKYELVAQVGLHPGSKQQSELYDAIPRRHTNRNPYHLTSLPPDFADAIRKIANDEADVKVFVFTSDDLAELTGDKEWQPTFMFRLGYPIREVGPSPRRTIQACLL
jgi:nitroreductase